MKSFLNVLKVCAVAVFVIPVAFVLAACSSDASNCGCTNNVCDECAENCNCDC